MKVIIASIALLLSFNSFAAKVVLGQSCALSGPTKVLGSEMLRGAQAFFSGNANIELKSLDDQYEPKKCEENTDTFISENVAALFGYVGTPTAKVAVAKATSAKKVFFGAFTGAGFLSDIQTNPYSFSVRASYDDETESMVNHLVNDKGIKKIAIFVQDDAFGDVGKSGVEKALKKRNLTLAGEGRYKRNTIAVKGGADEVIASGAQAVILVGAYKPCGTAIQYMKNKGLDVPFINISFVGSKPLAHMIKSDSKNVYITQVVPNPWDKSIPIVKEYQDKIGTNIDFISLEGYIAAKIMTMAIDKAGAGASDSEKLKSAIESLGTFDIGGLQASFSANDHRALSDTYLSKVNGDGSFSYVNKIE